MFILFAIQTLFLFPYVWFVSILHSLPFPPTPNNQGPLCPHYLYTGEDNLFSQVSMSDLLIGGPPICSCIFLLHTDPTPGQSCFHIGEQKKNIHFYSTIFISVFFSFFCSLQSSTHPHGSGKEGAIVWELPHRASMPRHWCHHDWECQLWPHRRQDLWRRPRTDGEHKVLPARCLQDHVSTVHALISVKVIWPRMCWGWTFHSWMQLIVLTLT